MKKILIVSNTALLCICLLLGFLLLTANARLRQAQAQGISTPISVAPTDRPSATITPAPEVLETRGYIDDYIFEYVIPFGSLPLPYAQKYCGRNIRTSISDIENHNPIDIFFGPYWPLAFSAMEENAMSGDYRDAWKEEMLHAYDLLAQLANPKAEYLRKELEETKEALLDFAKKDGDLFAMVFYSDAYTTISHFDERVSEGTGWPGASMMAQAGHYREYAIYLYRILDYLENVKPDFVFDPEPLRESWSYLLD